MLFVKELVKQSWISITQKFSAKRFVFINNVLKQKYGTIICFGWHKSTKDSTVDLRLKSIYLSIDVYSVNISTKFTY